MGSAPEGALEFGHLEAGFPFVPEMRLTRYANTPKRQSGSPPARFRRDMESTFFTPSLAQDLRENAVVALGIVVLAPVILYFSREGISLKYAIVCGVSGGLLALLLYTGRFLIFAPKRVEFSDRGLTLEFRSGETAHLAWAEVTGASFASIYGLRWKFRTTSSTLRLRGDGFSGMEWFRISQSISERLAARQIQVSTDSAGRKFLS
jgi:hypothetical protein